MLLSVIAIPVGMILGYVLSHIVLPLIAENITSEACKVYSNPFVFLACAVLHGLQSESVVQNHAGLSKKYLR